MEHFFHMRRLRVLLLAEQCNPDWPSLPVVGYKAAKAIAEVADVTLVTHIRNKPAITREGAGKAQVTYLDNEYIARPMYRLSRLFRGGDEVAWTTNIAMAYLPYVIFERLAWKAFGARLRAKEFDVVHRLTPMSPTLPSPLAGRSPVPFVLGPLNGGLKWPKEFVAELRREREWMTYLRSFYRVLPYARSTYARASAVLAAFPHTVADVPRAAQARTIELAEVGIDPELFHSGHGMRPGPTTFLFVGRLVPYKCADIAIEAFAGSEILRHCRMRVVGDGPELASLVGIVARHRAENRVEFLGRISQDEVGKTMREAHVFAFPSIRELGAGVVVEAMACGLCCLVVDYGAPGRLVDASRGVKVPLAEKSVLVRQMRKQMEQLANDRVRIAILGAEARRYVLAEYSWAAKAAKTLEVYRWVTGQRSDKPIFA